MSVSPSGCGVSPSVCAMVEKEWDYGSDIQLPKLQQTGRRILRHGKDGQYHNKLDQPLFSACLQVLWDISESQVSRFHSHLLAVEVSVGQYPML